jgi:hypothetical protein
MAVGDQSFPLPLCDGCGLPADGAHITRRIQRLELATRFRPIHIQLLFLGEAPPPRIEDYFYFANEDTATRHGLSRVLFEELMHGVGITLAEGKGEAALLGEFQRRGFFLADCLECPVEEIVPGVREGRVRANAFELSQRFGPQVALRVAQSYKPKYVVPISVRTRHILPFLRRSGLGDNLLLYQDLPLHFPHPHNPAAVTQFRAGLADVAVRAGIRI